MHPAKKDVIKFLLEDDNSPQRSRNEAYTSVMTDSSNGALKRAFRDKGDLSFDVRRSLRNAPKSGNRHFIFDEEADAVRRLPEEERLSVLVELMFGEYFVATTSLLRKALPVLNLPKHDALQELFNALEDGLDAAGVPPERHRAAREAVRYVLSYYHATEEERNEILRLLTADE